jgi:hypothetical protein
LNVKRENKGDIWSGKNANFYCLTFQVRNNSLFIQLVDR